MASHSLGLTLHQAAREKGVPFTLENEPTDHELTLHGMKFHEIPVPLVTVPFQP